MKTLTRTSLLRLLAKREREWNDAAWEALAKTSGGKRARGGARTEQLVFIGRAEECAALARLIRSTGLTKSGGQS